MYLVKSGKAGLVLALMVAANLLAALLVQILFFTVSAPPDAEALAKKDPIYENCTICDSLELSGTQVLMVELQDGTYQLVTLEKHLFLPRYRLVKKYTSAVTPSDETQEYWVKTANGGINMTYAGRYLGQNYAVMSNGGSLKNMLLIAAALTILELAVGSLFCKMQE